MQVTGRVFENRYCVAAMLLGLLSFSFVLTATVGRCGFFALDQSIIFDGGYRILSGQVPYRDFYLPYPPLTLWIQALSFCCFGVNYWAYVLPASIMNVIATACGVHFLRLLFPDDRRISLFGGLITAVWFYPIFGTTYPEQTAFFFHILGLTLLLHASLRPLRHESRFVMLLVSGCCAALSLLCKQNAGILIMPVYLILGITAALPEKKRVLEVVAILSAGILLTLIAFLAWVWLYSDWDSFILYNMVIPKQEGHRRLWGSGIVYLVRGLIKGKGNDILCILSLSWLVFTALFLFSFRRLLIDRLAACQGCRTAMIAGGFCFTGILYQNAFSLVSMNNGINEKPFLGIIAATIFGLSNFIRKNIDTPGTDGPAPRRLGVSVVLVLSATGLVISLVTRNGDPVAGTTLGVLLAAMAGLIELPRQEWISRARHGLLSHKTVTGVTAAAGLFIILFGLWSAVNRDAHGCFRNGYFKMAQFTESLPEERLAGLRWGTPTLVKGRDVQEHDLLDLIGYLRTCGENFFIFPDFTILYSVLRVPSPQPLLWFHEGLTYSAEHAGQLDGQIAESLERNQVRILVLESHSYKGELNKRLENFPRLCRYIRSNYREVEAFGIFQVYRMHSVE